MTDARDSAGSALEFAQLHARVDEARRVLNRLLQQMVVSMKAGAQASGDARLRDANERLLVAILDARELRHALRQAHRRHVDLLATIADELRDPQAPIRLAASVLGGKQVDATLLPRALSMFDAQMGRMKRMQAHLDGVIGAHLDPRTLPRERVDLETAMHGAVQLTRMAILARRQHVDLQLREKPLEVMGDMEHLVQVLANLLDNASKYSGEGQHVVVRGSRIDRGVLLEVCDEGIGLAPSGASRIFDPFWHDAEALAVDDTGVGIGLTVVRRVIALYGGSVQACSAGRGRGSRFAVTLPGVPK